MQFAKNMIKRLTNLENILNTLDGAYIQLNLTSDSPYFKQIKQSIIGLNYNSVFKPLVDI